MASDSSFEGWCGLDKNSAEGNMVWQGYTPKEWEETDVDIEISHCGVCGSDMHVLRKSSLPFLPQYQSKTHSNHSFFFFLLQNRIRLGTNLLPHRSRPRNRRQSHPRRQRRLTILRSLSNPRRRPRGSRSTSRILSPTRLCAMRQFRRTILQKQLRHDLQRNLAERRYRPRRLCEILARRRTFCVSYP